MPARSTFGTATPETSLVGLHINRELIHHLAEVCLLRDFHLHTHQQTQREAS